MYPTLGGENGLRTSHCVGNKSGLRLRSRCVHACVRACVRTCEAARARRIALWLGLGAQICPSLVSASCPWAVAPLMVWGVPCIFY